MNKLINKGIWIFSDYRSTFQNSATLQLITKAKELATHLDGHIGVILIGHNINNLVTEYSNYGVDKIFIVEDKKLKGYSSDLYTSIITELVGDYHPEILLIPGSDFGREIAPRIASRLRTGLSSDCISLDIDKNGNLIQTCTVINGNLLAEIITPDNRPQIATVRPGVFKEHQKCYNPDVEIIRPKIDLQKFKVRVKIKSSIKIEHLGTKLEKAKNVICAGLGIAQKETIEKVEELAVLIDAEIGCTRPLIDNNYYTHDRLIGQTGRTIKPQLLLVIGASGTTHLVSSFKNSKCIIAINKDPKALIFNYCDIGIIGEGDSILSRLISKIKNNR